MDDQEGGELQMDTGELLQCAGECGVLLSTWARSQATIFNHAQLEDPISDEGPAQVPRDPTDNPRSGPREQPLAFDRGALVAQLRDLLLHYSAIRDLPSALTLLDALTFRVGQGGQPRGELRWQAGELTEKSTLVAIVRLCIKCNGWVSPGEDWLHHRTEVLFTSEPTSIVDVTRKELMIVAAMSGRIALPSLASPEAWAMTVLERAWCLAAAGAIGGPVTAGPADPAGMVQNEQPEEPLEADPAEQSLVMDQLCLVSHNIHSWLEWLITQLAVTRELPPQMLAVAACVFTALSTGTMVANEVRPLDVADAAWEGSILGQHARLQEGQAAPQNGGPVLLARHLAQASCCHTEELRQWAFKVSLALQTRAAAGAAA